MPFVSQSEYARRHGITRNAVNKRTVDRGGPIPTYGADKKVDLEEADRLWTVTMGSQGLARSPFPGAAGAARERPRDPEERPNAADTVEGALGPHAYARARTAAMIADAQAKRLAVELRQGKVVDRDRATRRVFGFARVLRDACQTWPSRIGPELAAQFDLDAAAVTVALDEHVRQLLTELASERLEL